MLLRRRFTECLILIVCLLGIASSNIAAAHIPGQSQLGGWVYIDRNNDGILAFSNEPNPEFVIGEVEIRLFSQVGIVETLVSTTQSDVFGRYLFENIDPGMYVLRQTPPIEFVDGIDTLGTLLSLNGQPIPGNASAGAMADNVFFNIVLTADVAGEFYNFGERGLAAGYASKRFLFASFLDLPTPQPPPDPQGFPDPEIPEPTSLTLALMLGCGSWLVARRSRRGYACVLHACSFDEP